MSARAPWGTYQHIAQALRERIASGALAPGQALPSETALRQQFAVSRDTVRRALAELEAEGLVKALPRVGRLVCEPHEHTGASARTLARYRRIAQALRERIASGALAPGQALPSETALRQQFAVSRSTVRRALAELEAEGLVKALPGTGRVVCGPQERTGASALQYRRIAAELGERIASGALASGQALPSEAAIARHYAVSRGTARHALAELEGAGMITVVHGRGRFVA